MSAVGAPLRSSSALVATVVPCATYSTAPGATPAVPSSRWMPCRMPSEGSAGTDGSVATHPPGGGSRHGRALRDAQRAGSVVVQHEVGERPPDVDAKPISHPAGG